MTFANSFDHLNPHNDPSTYSKSWKYRKIAAKLTFARRTSRINMNLLHGFSCAFLGLQDDRGQQKNPSCDCNSHGSKSSQICSVARVKGLIMVMGRPYPNIQPSDDEGAGIGMIFFPITHGIHVWHISLHE